MSLCREVAIQGWCGGDVTIPRDSERVRRATVAAPVEKMTSSAVPRGDGPPTLLVSAGGLLAIRVSDPRRFRPSVVASIISAIGAVARQVSQLHSLFTRRPEDSGQSESDTLPRTRTDNFNYIKKTKIKINNYFKLINRIVCYKYEFLFMLLFFFLTIIIIN